MFPAAAFAEEMKKSGWEIGLMSDMRGLKYASSFPSDWQEEVHAASPNFRKPWTLPGAAMKIIGGINHAARLMKDRQPALVAGFGGYPAYPAIAAAKRLHVPVLIHEQNAVLGRVNRQFASYAKVVASGFKRLDRLPPRQKFRHITTGNPVRAPIAAMRDAPYPPTDGKLNLLITGGSQGATILGDVLPLAITRFPEPMKSHVTVVQQVRAEQLEETRQLYASSGIEATVETFFDDMPERLRDAHMVIARSGAGTVSEIAAVGRPSILIPLAIAMDDHQTANAEALVTAGAADIVQEKKLKPDLVGGLILVRLENHDELCQRAAAAREAGTITAASDLAGIAERVAGLG